MYPLLIPFLNLTFHLQHHSISCVEAVIIIEYYLSQMKDNMIKYEIPKEGYTLINLIEKRLLLNKNVQMYQLASLLTPDGIIRYRNIDGKEFNIQEDDNLYWHLKIEFLDRKYTKYDATQMRSLDFSSYIQDIEKFEEKYEEMLANKFGKLQKKRTNDNIKEYQKKKQLSLLKYYQKEVSNSNNANAFSKNLHENTDIDDSNSDDENSNEKIERSNSISHSISHSKDFHENTDIDDSNSDIDHSLQYCFNESSSDDDDEKEEEEEEEEDDFEYNHSKYDISDERSYKYFDETETEEEEKETNAPFYETQKKALKWINIANLITNNAAYFDLSDDEANLAVIELHDLLTMHFSVLYNQNSSSICPQSNFLNYWSLLSDFEHNGHTFEHIAKIAFRLYTIPPSESGSERSFSKLKWRFPDRRNRTKHDSMMNEIHIAEYHAQKISQNKSNSKPIWNLPPHKPKK